MAVPVLLHGFETRINCEETSGQDTGIGDEILADMLEAADKETAYYIDYSKMTFAKS